MQPLKASGSKEKILKRIRKALDVKVPQPFANIDNQTSVYTSDHHGLEMQFAQAFTELGGNFIYCEDASEFVTNFNTLLSEKKWNSIVCWDKKLLELFAQKNINQITSFRDTATVDVCDAGITGCEFLVARTGTITLSSKQESGRTLSIFPPIHIVIAFTNQVVNDLKDAITEMKQKFPERLPSLINFATGPSRTADIEKTLVVGVHGPKEVFVFLIDETMNDN